MLSEERVKLMTRLESYEDTEGKKTVPVSRHFRSDYIGLQILKAIICATIAYMIVFGAYIYYNFETLMLDIYKIDLAAFAGNVIRYYVIFLVVYCVIVYIAFTVKYHKAKKSIKRYFNNLKLLNAMYAKEAAEAEHRASEASEG